MSLEKLPLICTRNYLRAKCLCDPNLVCQQNFFFAHGWAFLFSTTQLFLRCDELFVSSETFSLKGWVGGFLPLLTENFSSFPPCFLMKNLSHPQNNSPITYLLQVLFNKATPFQPRDRKVLNLSPVKKDGGRFSIIVFSLPNAFFDFQSLTEIFHVKTIC